MVLQRFLVEVLEKVKGDLENQKCYTRKREPCWTAGKTRPTRTLILSVSRENVGLQPHPLGLLHKPPHKQEKQFNDWSE